MLYKTLYDKYGNFATKESSPNEGGWVRVSCVFTDKHSGGADTRPSAAYNVNSGVYKCFTCGTTLSVWKFLVEHLRITFSEAEQIVHQHTGAFKSEESSDLFVAKNPNIARFQELESRIIYSLKDWDIAREFAERKGITVEVMEKLGVGILTGSNTNWGRTSLVFPYRLRNKIVGLRYRDFLGNKGGENGSLLLPWGLDDFDPNLPTIIVEGETDRLSLYHHGQGVLNVNIISTPTGMFSQSWARIFENYSHPIIVVPQEDETGIRLPQEVQKILPRHDVYTCRIPWQRDEIGKDFAEWAMDHDPAQLFKKFWHKLATLNSSQIVSARDFEEHVLTLGDEDYLVQNLILADSLTVLGGKQKSFKTWAALELIRTFLSGEPLWGIPEFTGTRENNKVLLLEAEGSIKKFNRRIYSVLSGIDYKSNLFIGHRTRYKLDRQEDVEELLKIIHENEINCLVIDPLRNFHHLQEDSSDDTTKIVESLSYLTANTPGLSTTVLHHFHKSGQPEDLWDALRGSSALAGAADLGIFIGKTNKTNVKVCIDGREYSLNQDQFSLEFDTVNSRLLIPQPLTNEEVARYKNYLGHLESTIKRNEVIDLDKVCQDYNMRPEVFLDLVNKSSIVEFNPGGKGRGNTRGIKRIPKSKNS